MQYVSHYFSTMGELLLTSDGEALTGLSFKGEETIPVPVQSACPEEVRIPAFEQTKRWLDVYFTGRDPGILPPVRLQGTPFREAVWQILLTIPYGTTVTYGEIAGRIAQEKKRARMSAQAVGGAVGHNPIPILVPCHRVIGSDGSLTGYSAGIRRKEYLLKLEKISWKR